MALSQLKVERLESETTAKDSAFIEIEHWSRRALTWVELEDAMWSALVQYRAADLPLEGSLPSALDALASSSAATCARLPKSARTPALLSTLGEALGPETHLILRSRALGEASADATSRVLERAAECIAARITWCVPEQAWGEAGVVRLRGPDNECVEALRGPQGSDSAWEAEGEGPSPPIDVRIGPILGRPHPGSPAELRLFQALEGCEDLADRFLYNWRVATVTGRQPIVDLVSKTGPLCVEVDSFRYHGGRSAFARDRHRDYELLASGRVVLRLTHDEIMEDVAIAMNKIRRVLGALGDHKGEC